MLQPPQVLRPALARQLRLPIVQVEVQEAAPRHRGPLDLALHDRGTDLAQRPADARGVLGDGEGGDVEDGAQGREGKGGAGRSAGAP